MSAQRSNKIKTRRKSSRCMRQSPWCGSGHPTLSYTRSDPLYLTSWSDPMATTRCQPPGRREVLAAAAGTTREVDRGGASLPVLVNLFSSPQFTAAWWTLSPCRNQITGSRPLPVRLQLHSQLHGHYNDNHVSMSHQIEVGFFICISQIWDSSESLFLFLLIY